MFDQSGSLICYQKRNVTIAIEVECSGNHDDYDIVEEPINFKGENVNLENCLSLNALMVSDLSYKSNLTYTRSVGPRGRNLSFTMCYVLRRVYNIPRKVKCNEEISNYKINPRNFVFIRGNDLLYLPPSVAQYLFLERINNPTMSANSSVHVVINEDF